jgi:chromosome segregation ATPase
MTNEELAIKIDNLSDIVANLAKTMDERFKQIDQRFKQIDERFEQINHRFKQIDERFEQIDRRFELIDERFEQINERFRQVDERFEQIDEQLADIRKDHKTLVDIVKDMDLAADERFQELKAGQAELAANQESLRADLAVVRRELYHESGSREMVDDTLYNSLDKRLRRVEAKFPDLASSQAA